MSDKKIKKTVEELSTKALKKEAKRLGCKAKSEKKLRAQVITALIVEASDSSEDKDKDKGKGKSKKDKSKKGEEPRGDDEIHKSITGWASRNKDGNLEISIGIDDVDTLKERPLKELLKLFGEKVKKSDEKRSLQKRLKAALLAGTPPAFDAGDTVMYTNEDGDRMKVTIADPDDYEDEPEDGLVRIEDEDGYSDVEPSTLSPVGDDDDDEDEDDKSSDDDDEDEDDDDEDDEDKSSDDDDDDDDDDEDGESAVDMKQAAKDLKKLHKVVAALAKTLGVELG